jgi:signal transduction histidine kinase
LPRRGSARPAWTADVLPAVLATALQLLSVRAGDAPPPPDLLAGVAGGVLSALATLAQGALLLWRRTRPVAVLAGCAAAYAVTAAVLPGAPPYAGWFALYAAGVYTRPGRRAAAVVTAGAAAFVLVIGVAAAAYRSTGGALVPLVLGTVIVALVATVVRSRRAQLDALRDRAAALERERETAVARAAAEERLRIARDLHDLVGHGLSSIAVQSSTARLALDAGRLEAARVALSAVESSSRTAMREMRQLLGVLRADEAGDYGPAPGLADLPTLVDRLRAQGAPVTLSAGGLGGVPDAVSLAAYRVVQEALTNAVKHAPGSRVTVAVSAAGGTVQVAVEDYAELPALPPGERAGGQGLLGMRERVAAFGGELDAGPAGDHPGWRVRARIPYPEEANG